MWVMDWSEWKEGGDYPVGLPLWQHRGEPIGKVSEIKDCCGGLMFKVDMDMSLYKKPKKKEKKKMFGRKDKEIKKLKKDLEFWMNMDDLNNRILCSYHDIVRTNEATIRLLEDANERLKEDLETTNTRLTSADNAAQYWLKKALSAREELIRRNECSGFDALKIYTLKSENLQLKKDNAELVDKCAKLEESLKKCKVINMDAYVYDIPRLLAYLPATGTTP